MSTSTAELRNAVGKFLVGVKESYAHARDDLLDELARESIDSVLSKMEEFVQKLFAIHGVEAAALLFTKEGGHFFVLYMEWEAQGYERAMNVFVDFKYKLPLPLRPSPWIGTPVLLSKLSTASLAEHLKNEWEKPFLVEDIDLIKGFNPELGNMSDEEVVHLWNEELPPSQVIHIAIFKRSEGDSIETSVHSY